MPLPRERELELDLGTHAGLGEVRVQPAVATALARPVEREGDRVEHRRLAGAGRSVEQEQPADPERVEVDVLLAGERPERAQSQPVQPHRPPRAHADTSARPRRVDGVAQRIALVGSG